MSQPTLLSIIQEISLSSVRKKSTDSEGMKSRWTKEDEKIIFQLLVQYGQDISLLHSYFPKMTRKQVKRKAKQTIQKRKVIFMKLEERAERVRRKSFFDEEILEESGKFNVASL